MSMWFWCSSVYAWLTYLIALLTSKLAVQIYETIQFLSPQDVVPQSVLREASKDSTTYYQLRMIKQALSSSISFYHIVAMNKCLLVMNIRDNITCISNHFFLFPFLSSHPSLSHLYVSAFTHSLTHTHPLDVSQVLPQNVSLIS